MCSKFIIVATLSYYDVTSIFSRLAVTFWLCLDLKNEKSLIKKNAALHEWEIFSYHV
jgi:murein endopeptidase